MPYNPDIHKRQSIRLAGYDYSQPGAYFITICAHNRECRFGEMVAGEMRLNDAGKMVEQCWNEIPNHFSHATLDQFVIMPNHIHGIIFIVDSADSVRARHAVPQPVPQPVPQRTTQSEQFGRPVVGSIPTIIRSFKSTVTKQINEIRQTPGRRVWQRNYYERVILNDHELQTLRQYIDDNPIKWAEDENHPNHL